MKRLIYLIIGLAVYSLDSAQAALVYSGLLNIVIPTTFDGTYINLDNGAVSGSAFTGWDINPFFGGAGVANNTNFQPVRIGTGNSDPALRVYTGELVSSAQAFSSGMGGFGDPVSHLGSGLNQFSVGSEGYIGFRFTNDASAGPYYGWMRATFTNNSSGGVIHDWAYENTGSSITVGSVPEPSRAMLLFVGFVTLISCRRRRK
jgi:hypothetical protein